MLSDRLRVLDPLCGRGTTLNQALMYGWHAAGVDRDERDFEAYAAFLSRWLKDKRLKHTARSAKLRREGRTLGRRFDAELAESKDDWAAGDTISVTTAAADTLEAAQIFKAASFDVVVTDAPYGVQHGSQGSDGLRRSPLDLLGEALPGWVRLLKPGGAVGVAVNVRTARRERVQTTLAEAGLEPVDSPSYRGFEHRVDQAILRDLIVAVKPGPPGADRR
jgi:tRNA G10  N-methylase Trm11